MLRVHLHLQNAEIRGRKSAEMKVGDDGSWGDQGKFRARCMEYPMLLLRVKKEKDNAGNSEEQITPV